VTFFNKISVVPIMWSDVVRWWILWWWTWWYCCCCWWWYDSEWLCEQKCEHLSATDEVQEGVPGTDQHRYWGAVWDGKLSDCSSASWRCQTDRVLLTCLIKYRCSPGQYFPLGSVPASASLVAGCKSERKKIKINFANAYLLYTLKKDITFFSVAVSIL